MNLWRVGTLACTVALAASGCVTKTTYERLESEKNREIASLQAEREELQRQRTALEGQIEKLEAQRSGLEQQRLWLEQESVALQTRVGMLGQQKTTLEKEKAALEQEKSALEEQKTALEEQKAALVEQQAELQRQVQELERQKDQLLASSQETQAQYDALVRNLTVELEKGQLQVRRYKNMLTVDVAEQLFFDSGQASLKETGKAVLKKVGDTLKGYDDKIIRIIGHTDNVPIAKAAQNVYPSNWELSVARATTVVRYLQDVGIPPERMVASGRAEFAPVASNDDAEGRKKNRRIEITLIDRSLMQEFAEKAR